MPKPALIIRKEQIDALSNDAEKRYVNRLIDYLKKHFPEAAQTPPAQMRMAVKEQIAKARSYRLITERQIAKYVITAWVMGPNFDKDYPAAKQTLTSKKTAEQKSKWLADWTKLFFRLKKKGA